MAPESSTSSTDQRRVDPISIWLCITRKIFTKTRIKYKYGASMITNNVTICVELDNLEEVAIQKSHNYSHSACKEKPENAKPSMFHLPFFTWLYRDAFMETDHYCCTSY